MQNLSGKSGKHLQRVRHELSQGETTFFANIDQTAGDLDGLSLVRSVECSIVDVKVFNRLDNLRREVVSVKLSIGPETPCGS